jgi:hypothetical protein
LRNQVTIRPIVCKLAELVLLASTACGGVIWAQQSSGRDGTQQKVQQPSSTLGPLPEETMKSPVAPCIRPAPALQWEDYEGPFAKLASIFARRLERRSVRAPHYKPGVLLCTFPAKDKFILFAQDVIDPGPRSVKSRLKLEARGHPMIRFPNLLLGADVLSGLHEIKIVIREFHPV